MKIVPYLPQHPDTEYAKALNRELSKILQQIVIKLNAIGDGRISGADLVAATIPTTGMYAQGDFIRNSAPVEAGAAASKYVVTGWVCTVGGSPGTLLQCRVLTGN